MNPRKHNSIDQTIEQLTSEFAKIKGFETLQESEEGRAAFDLIIKNISELQTFQTLYLKYYIPAANRSIADAWQE
jgi:hypothetical protein